MGEDMSAVKWTGEGFKLVGRILTSEVVEDWINQEGGDFFNDTLKKINWKWWFRDLRVKREIQRMLPGFEGTGDAFRIALSNELDSLPRLLSIVAGWLVEHGPPELVDKYANDWVAAVPRKFILEQYQGDIIRKLGDAAALRSFPGLASRLLTSTATEAEKEFSKAMQRKPVLALREGLKSHLVLGVSPDTEWWRREIKGHYYVGFDYIGKSLDTSGNIVAVSKELDQLKEKLHDQIGRMKTNTMDVILAKLDAIQ
jgi:hypothetical protein